MLDVVARKWGYDPVCVEDGDAAWQIMQQKGAPCLMLLDWEMPHMDGLSLCRRIRKDEHRSQPYIILLTARSETDDVVAGLEAGANEYITKPFNNTELRARLQAGKRMVELQERLKEALGRLRLTASVFSHASEGIVITDLDGTIIEVNEAFERITGYIRDEAVGKNPSLLKSGRHNQDFYQAMWHGLTHNGHWSGEIWNRHRNGEIYAEMLTINAVEDSQGELQHYVAMFTDITAQKEHERRLEHIAHYDALTGLPNRVLLADRLHQAMSQSKRSDRHLAVAYLDLDGFKEVNDSHGHEVGDQLLVTIAKRMKEILREGDTISRLGGDEFVAVLIDLQDTRDSLTLLTRLLEAASQPVHVAEHTLQVSASVGVTFYADAEQVEPDQLLRQADQAMYQAKLAGKNRYHIFDAEQDRNVRGHHESLEHIRRALNEDEFVLYYQPKVNMRTGEVFGLEALIRWQHPEQGLLSPMTFLPVIENHQLAIDVGEWVLHTALAQLEVWLREGFELTMSVNVGALQLQQSDFTDRLRVILSHYPTIKPGQLELEVLETSALGDIERVSEVMLRCHEMGVDFALDDFGTGYSSLTYLKRLPAKQLKIDQSFVRDMLDDPEDLAILEGVLGLAAAFRREAIAEGVETVEHGDVLLQLGCEQAQGYGIARPMPAENFIEWAAHWQPETSWKRLHRVSRDDLAVLFASVEHRAWIRAIEENINGDSGAPPPLDHHQCRFGAWLDTEGKKRHGDHSAYVDIHSLHLEVHKLARELLALEAENRQAEAEEGLNELRSLRDALLEQLQRLL